MGNTFVFIFLAPLALIGFFEIYFIKPDFFFWVLILVNATIVFSLKKVKGGRFFSKEFGHSLILPLLFVNSVAAYSLIVPYRLVSQILFLTSAVFIFYYFKNIGRENNERFLENISSYGGFLAVFFFFSFFYGLKAFLGTPIWILILATTILTTIAIFEVLWANRIPLQKGSVYIFLACLLIVQLAWALYFLPLSYNFLGLVLAICYYIIIGVAKPLLRGALSKKTVKLYLICGLASISAVLLAAKWL